MMKSKGRLLKDVEKEYKALARQINLQIKEMKKAGYEKSPAVNVLFSKISTGNIGKKDNVLLKPKQRNKVAYEKAIIELQKFMTYKTATKEGYDALIQERIETIRNNYDAESLSDSQIKDILNFMGSQSGELAKEIYDSDQILYAVTLAKVKDKGKSLDEIFDDLKEKGKTIADYIRGLEESADNEFINL